MKSKYYDCFTCFKCGNLTSFIKGVSICLKCPFCGSSEIYFDKDFYLEKKDIEEKLYLKAGEVLRTGFYSPLYNEFINIWKVFNYLEGDVIEFYQFIYPFLRVNRFENLIIYGSLDETSAKKIGEAIVDNKVGKIYIMDNDVFNVDKMVYLIRNSVGLKSSNIVGISGNVLNILNSMMSNRGFSYDMVIDVKSKGKREQNKVWNELWKGINSGGYLIVDNISSTDVIDKFLRNLEGEEKQYPLNPKYGVIHKK